jgi:hypothetical protein
MAYMLASTETCSNKSCTVYVKMMYMYVLFTSSEWIYLSIYIYIYVGDSHKGP